MSDPLSNRAIPVTDAEPSGPSGSASDTVRVLYIGGWGRSGSTLLDRMLGQVPGVCSLGEVREIWRHGCRENRPCGCGQPFLGCGFWSEVGRRAFGGWEELDLDEILHLRYSLDRPWRVPALLLPRGGVDAGTGVGRYLEVLGALYRSIRDVSGADVVVDSSKLPSHALLLRRAPGIDLRMVHLVRDSRGVAFSWKKQVSNRVTAGEPRYLERYGPFSASGRYVLYNGLTRLVGTLGVPYLFLRYEDLVRDPARRLRTILRHAGLPVDEATLGFVGDGHVRLDPNHTADGNPMRFAVGDVAVRMDDEWGRRMDRFDRSVVTTLTSPMLLAYRYPLRPTATGGGAP